MDSLLLKFPFKNRTEFYDYYNFMIIKPNLINPANIKLKNKKDSRNNPLSKLKVFIKPDGSKACCWCLATLQTPVHHSRKYCSEECSRAAYYYGYPQKARIPLLFRQDFKCNICKFDYLPYFFKILKEKYLSNYEKLPDNYEADGLIKLEYVMDGGLLRELVYEEKLIEVDHKIPVKMGGDTYGLNNVQAICKECHKNKTKIDIKMIHQSKRNLF